MTIRRLIDVDMDGVMLRDYSILGIPDNDKNLSK